MPGDAAILHSAVVSRSAATPFEQGVTSTPTVFRPIRGDGPRRFWLLKAAGAMRIKQVRDASFYVLAAGEEVKLKVHGSIILVADDPR